MSSPSEDIREQQTYYQKNVPGTVSLFLDPKLGRSDIYLSKNQIERVDSEEKLYSGNFKETVQGLIGSRKRQEPVKNNTVSSLKKLCTQLRQYFKKTSHNLAVVEHASMSKMLALLCLADNRELEACSHLVMSHASCFRQQILYRNLKSKLRAELLSESLVDNLNPKDLDIDLKNANTNPDKLVSTLAELPSDWYVLQLTSQHEHISELKSGLSKGQKNEYTLKPMNGLHIVVLPTGKNAINPICITLPKPHGDSSYDVRVEVGMILNSNKSDLTATYTNNELYWKMRKQQNDRMSTAIFELEFSWLREWRVLLLADYIECLDLVHDVYNMIDKLIADSNVKDMPERTRWLLRKIATGACYLQPFEIERAVTYILSSEKKLAKNIILSIVAKTKVMEPLLHARRKILVLIVDEFIDHFSYESFTILKHQPVTRFPSLHIAYALYNQHKNTMKNGYKLIKKSENLGTFIVNPSLDLTKMEIRMKLFLEYWLPKWKGLYSIKPELEYFKKTLTEYHILMYNGHGSGIQFLKGEDIEKMRILALVLLFGCNSIKLLPTGGRNPSYGVSNQYLMGCSPCILGMLWEVTDGDIDRMTANFLSKWIPSSAKRSWSDVNLSLWNQGKLEFQKGTRNEIKFEDNMLVAVAKSKDVCKQYMTSAAIIVRGLPTKLVD
ncbi:separin [Phymastichus coffea]|uniref:separin n=1 Tax=Phymastichus coffea TaxID=108790 RepID=UPI00273C13E5|nr:separin [Phymastichus coffea]